MTDKQGDAAWKAAQDSVIGSMLIDPECIPEVMLRTGTGDFTGLNLALYNAIRRLYGEHREIDAVIVLEALQSEGKAFPELRGYMMELMKTTPTAANVMEYVGIVREKSRLNALRELSFKLSAAASLDEARELVAKAQELIVERRGAGPRKWAEMIDSFMEARKDNRELDFLDWGIPALNATVHAAAAGGKYILLGGDSSAGKSALMFQLAHYMSRKRRVCVFSFETEEEEMTERMASASSQVGFGDIVRNRLTVGDWKKLNDAFSLSYGNRLYTVDAPGMTAEDVAGVTRAYRFDVIFVDYIQLVTPGGDRRDIREQQVAKISRTFKLLAKQEPRVTVVALSQLSRPEKDVKKKTVREPTIHDFRESGQLENDADVAMILYKPYPDAEDRTPKAELRVLSIVKNKKDSLAKLNLRFDGAHQTFRPLTAAEAKRVESADYSFVLRTLEHEGQKRREMAQEELPL